MNNNKDASQLKFTTFPGNPVRTCLETLQLTHQQWVYVLELLANETSRTTIASMTGLGMGTIKNVAQSAIVNYFRQMTHDGTEVVPDGVIRPDPLLAAVPPEMYVGRCVKRLFDHDNGGEHMWMWVESVSDDVLFGRLDNEPKVVSHLRLGDRVNCRLDQIEKVQSINP